MEAHFWRIILIIVGLYSSNRLVDLFLGCQFGLHGFPEEFFFNALICIMVDPKLTQDKKFNSISDDTRTRVCGKREKKVRASQL